jgi:hypothetical protein
VFLTLGIESYRCFALLARFGTAIAAMPKVAGIDQANVYVSCELRDAERLCNSFTSETGGSCAPSGRMWTLDCGVVSGRGLLTDVQGALTLGYIRLASRMLLYRQSTKLDRQEYVDDGLARNHLPIFALVQRRKC